MCKLTHKAVTKVVPMRKACATDRPECDGQSASDFADASAATCQQDFNCSESTLHVFTIATLLSREKDWPLPQRDDRLRVSAAGGASPPTTPSAVTPSSMASGVKVAPVEVQGCACPATAPAHG